MPSRSRLLATRVLVPPAPSPADANIYRRYVIERAAWIWHPTAPPTETAHVRFSCGFTLDRRTRITLHVSADQRHELLLDGHLVARGPHRSDRLHWSFESYAVTLPRGRHELSAVVSWLAPGLAPYAQVTYRGGFLLAAEGLDPAVLDTGQAPWRARLLEGIAFRPPLPHTFHVVGPGYSIDGPLFHRCAPALPARVLPKAWHLGPGWYGNGSIRSDWPLHPSPLPAMLSTPRRRGRVRAVAAGLPETSPERFGKLRPQDRVLVARINALLGGRTELRLAPGSRLRVVIDLGDYYCGYPTVRLRGSGNATLEWAEALFGAMTDYGKPIDKGDRDGVAGKFFHGFGDAFAHEGPSRTYRPFWWRAGRYWLLTVVAGSRPFVIEDIRFEETRFPLVRRDRFVADRPAWPPLQRILWRGIQTGSHEVFTDSPYYEQMMYVGDSRLHALCHFACAGEDRLVRRSLELFDWSRWRTGFVAERTPSDPYQLSLTFTCLWVGMVRDFALWRSDAAFVRDRLPAIRGVVEAFLPLRRPDGLLARLPGWSFVDWVEDWRRGIPPGEREDGSASVNLHFLLLLQAAADLEAEFGDALLSRRVRDLARATGKAILRTFWDPELGLLAEDRARSRWSEHAQALALIAGLLPPPDARRAVTALLGRPDLARCSIYFTHYWIEAMRLAGEGQRIVARLDDWTALLKQGFRTPPERLVDTRSDNHAWSSHPLFHYHATVAGVRPAAPGFARVRIAPLPGPLPHVYSVMPHPSGTISTRLDFREGGCRAAVRLPPGVGGEFYWAGRRLPLRPGENRIAIDAAPARQRLAAGGAID